MLKFEWAKLMDEQTFRSDVVAKKIMMSGLREVVDIISSFGLIGPHYSLIREYSA